MCWCTRKIPELKIASKNISVFKIFSVDVHTGKIKSPIYDLFTWEPYVVRESVMDMPYKIGEIIPVYIIDQGLHCFKVAPYLGSRRNKKYLFTFLVRKEPVNYWYLTPSKRLSSKPLFRANLEEKVFKCVIPKGAKYYINEDDEIVTDQLKLVEQVKS